MSSMVLQQPRDGYVPYDQQMGKFSTKQMRETENNGRAGSKSSSTNNGGGL